MSGNNKMGSRSIFDAVRDGDVAYVTRILQRKIIGVNVPELETRKTLLMVAAASGNVEIVKLLIKHEADVNLKDKDKGTALIYAIAQAPEETRKEVVKLLLDAGADVLIEYGHHGNALACAKKLEPFDAELVAMMQKILDEKLAKVLWTYYYPETEKIKQKNKIIELINAGADVNAVVTSYWHSNEYDYHKKQNYIKYIAGGQRSILQIALDHRWPEECIKLILDKVPKINTEMQKSLIENYFDRVSIGTIKYLLEKGFDPKILTVTNVKNHYHTSRTTLSYVVNRNRYKSGHANYNPDETLELLKLFLNKGVDPNYIGEGEIIFRSPLIQAMESNSKETTLKMLEILLQAGADPLLSQKFEYNNPPTTPLDYAFKKFKDGYSSWKHYIVVLAQNVAVKQFDNNDPLVLAVIKLQLENIKMLTDISSLRLAKRSDEDCNTLEQSLEKAMEANEFLQKYEVADPEITECLTNLQKALLERLAEKEAPKKGWFSGLLPRASSNYKPIASGHDEDEPRTIEQAKEAAKNKNPRRPS